MSGHSGYGDDNDNSPPPTYEGIVKGRPGYPPGDGWVPGDSLYVPPPKSTTGGSNVSTRSRSGRSGHGSDDDTYEPDTYNSRSAVAHDGYERDGISDAYEERAVGYGGRPVRGQGYADGYVVPAVYRRYEQTPQGYRRRVYDEVDEYDRRRVDRYRERERSVSRSRSRKSRDHSSSRSSSSSSFERGNEKKDVEKDHKEENSATKKWTATLAGAALGGLAAHKAKHRRDADGANWFPAAIGAVVGGFMGREAEKEVYKRREHRREERAFEEERRR